MYRTKRITRSGIKLTALKNSNSKAARKNRARRLKHDSNKGDSTPKNLDSQEIYKKDDNYSEDRKRKRFLKKQFKRSLKSTKEE